MIGCFVDVPSTYELMWLTLVTFDFDYLLYIMMMLMMLYADDEDDDFLELDTSSLAFLQNLDMHVNGSLRLSDSDLDSIASESRLLLLQTTVSCF